MRVERRQGQQPTGPEAYAAHAGFVAPARAFPELWRLTAGIALAFIAYFFFMQLYVLWLVNQDPGLARDVFEGRSPGAMLLLLFSFVFMCVSAALAARIMHRRSFASLIGPVRQAVGQFAAVSVVMVAVLAAVAVLPPWGMDAPLEQNLEPGRWLVFLVPAVALVLVQVSAEEVVFRGYIQQQLAARFASPFVWMVLPAALFSWGHYMPETAGENAILIVIWAGMFGLLMADLTARAGTLGPAIAVHFWNNALAILFVAVPDELNGLALFLSPISLADTEALRAWLPVDFAMMIVMWLAARLALRR